MMFVSFVFVHILILLGFLRGAVGQDKKCEGIPKYTAGNIASNLHQDFVFYFVKNGVSSVECCASICAKAHFCQSAVLDVSASTCSLAYVAPVKCSEMGNKTQNLTGSGLVMINCIQCNENGTASQLKDCSAVKVAASVGEDKSQTAAADVNAAAVASTTLSSTSTTSELASTSTYSTAKHGSKATSTRSSKKGKSTAGTLSSSTQKAISSPTPSTLGNEVFADAAPGPGSARASTPSSTVQAATSTTTTTTTKRKRKPHPKKQSTATTTVAPTTSSTTANSTTTAITATTTIQPSSSSTSASKSSTLSSTNRANASVLLETIVTASMILVKSSSQSQQPLISTSTVQSTVSTALPTSHSPVETKSPLITALVGAGFTIEKSISLQACMCLCAGSWLERRYEHQCRSLEYYAERQECFLNFATSSDPGFTLVTLFADNGSYWQFNCYRTESEITQFVSTECKNQISTPSPQPLPADDTNEHCFETLHGYILTGQAGGLEHNVSIDECKCLCAANTKYNIACKSAIYYHKERDCVLNLDTRVKRPDLFRRDTTGFDVTYIGIVCPDKIVKTYASQRCPDTEKEDDVADTEASNNVASWQDSKSDSLLKPGDNNDRCYFESPHFVLRGMATAIESHVSLAACKCFCAVSFKRYGFTCKSIQYYFDMRTCLLNREERIKQADRFVKIPGLLPHSYFDFRCSEDEQILDQFTATACRGLADFDSSFLLSRNNITSSASSTNVPTATATAAPTTTTATAPTAGSSAKEATTIHLTTATATATTTTTTAAASTKSPTTTASATTTTTSTTTATSGSSAKATATTTSATPTTTTTTTTPTTATTAAAASGSSAKETTITTLQSVSKTSSTTPIKGLADLPSQTSTLNTSLSLPSTTPEPNVTGPCKFSAFYDMEFKGHLLDRSIVSSALSCFHSCIARHCRSVNLIQIDGGNFKYCELFADEPQQYTIDDQLIALNRKSVHFGGIQCTKSE